jgi:hypothetical protein
MLSLLKKGGFLALFIVFLLVGGVSHAQQDREKIDSLILQKRLFNKENKTSKVFRIQLYNGNENEAYEIEKEFRKEFPEYKSTITYRQPEWKTQVGNFKSRLEADRVLLLIRKKFSGAIVLEDKI